jgi:glycosyltransferase involved in cell wall biosynthesis
MPGVEDFGMVPVEAQACGRPVVVLAEGGALESVVDGVTGIHVRDASVEAFADALNDVSTRAWDGAEIRAHAETFGKARFQQEFQKVVGGVSDAARYAQDPRNPAAREAESTAARYAQNPRNPAARETKQ